MNALLDAETKYRLLARVSHEIRDTLDLDEILNHLLDMVNSVMEYDAAGIFVLSEDFFEPQKRRMQTLIDGIALRGFDLPPMRIDPMLSEGKGIVGHVIRTGECVVAPDVRADSRYVPGRKRTLSEITVPIMRNERAIGALNLESDTIGAYGDGNLEILRFFADAAAISIEKATLHRQILEKKRIEDQLNLARQVQSRLLPDNPLDVPGYDIAGTSISAFGEIGGDYFDYLQLPNGRIGIVVADVSGHGIPAALIMTAFRALLRTHAQRESEPDLIAKALNRLLPEFIGEEHYVTSVYGVLDPLNGRFNYINCGHKAPMLFRADGRIEQLKIGGPVLSGALVGAAYNAFEIDLARGDTLVLYTDGVVEIEDGADGEFGDERLKMLLQRSLDLPVSEIIRTLIKATQEFSGSENYHDDFTLVLVRRM
jgi:sigma-B regulation protein RsbU (phosphoserine phosphatase)